ncbi:hypothetical protein BN946_scf184962.g38 [Trametes cinnabarina]|uniref:Peptidase A1 domain-containing protein n=1 Tax=Pycnoporus cinnabarinus TaxID=5643 RepID=A0A060SCK6_PYCCI|nr:hypothetical protein BN946_scf184962.g38 [Trametes cinnabarina]
MTEIMDAPLLQSPIPGRWFTLLDGIYVNGEFINDHSDFFKYPGNAKLNWTEPVTATSTAAELDTGTSGILAPSYYAEAIYGRIPGATQTMQGNSTYWLVPCNIKMNITWSFAGGFLYPMHPADVIDVQFNSNGTFSCIGTIFPTDPSDDPEFDFILGATFLRNTYQLYDYGDMSRGLYLAQPAARLLSLIEPDKAWAEADAMLLDRLVAGEEFYQANAARSATLTALPVHTGSVSSVRVTMIDDKAAPTSAAVAALHIAGALSQDDDKDQSSPVDLSTLTRNANIILALLAGVFVLLLVVIVLSIRASRANKGYLAVPSATFAGGDKTFEASESYSTPYDTRP